MSTTQIEFACPQCHHAHRLPAAYDGRKGRCVSCGTVIRVRPGVAERHVSSAERRGLPATRSTHFADSAPSRPSWREPGRTPLVPLVALAAVLALTSGAYAVGRLLTAPDDALACMPKSLTVVAQVRVGEALETFGLQDRLAQHQAAFAEAGFDPRSDLDHVYVGADPQQANPEGEGVLVLIEGDFDLDQLRTAAQREGQLEVESRLHAGFPYWVVQEPRTGLPLACSLLRADLLALGRPATVEAAIDTAIGGAPSVLDNPALASLIADGLGQLFWLATTVDATTAQALPMGQSVTSVLIGLDADGSSLALTGAAQFGDAAEATQVQAALQDGLGKLRDGAAGLPVDVGQWLQDDVVSTQGDRLEVELRLDAEQVKQATADAGA